MLWAGQVFPAFDAPTSVALQENFAAADIDGKSGFPLQVLLQRCCFTDVTICGNILLVLFMFQIELLDEIVCCRIPLLFSWISEKFFKRAVSFTGCQQTLPFDFPCLNLVLCTSVF